MGAHSRCLSLGEIEHLPKIMALDTPCSCGQSARDCPFWNEVAEDLKRRVGVDIRYRPYDFPVGLYQASRVIDPRHHTSAYLLKRRFMLAIKQLQYALGWDPGWLSWMTAAFEIGVKNTFLLYETMRRVSGQLVLIDSSKDHRKGIALYRRAPDQVRLLILTRDARGVYRSKRKSSFDRRASTLPWRRYYEHALPLIQRNVPEKHRHYLRYEDLAQDPASTLARLCDFLELTYEPEMLQFRQARHHILNGNDMRLSSEQTIRLDERWRSELDDEELAYFEKVSGKMNRKLGYE